MKAVFLKFIKATFIIYSVSLSYVFYIDYKYEKELEAFDVNANGLFESSEINKEQEAVIKKVINDTGRNLAPFTLIPFSIIVSLLFLVVTRKK